MNIFNLYLIVLWAISLVILEFVEGVNPYIKISLILVFAILCIHFYNEIQNINNYISNVLKNKKKSIRNLENIHFISKATVTLRELVSCFERRLLSLVKDSIENESESLNNPVNFLKKINIDDAISKEEFFKNILNILSTFFSNGALVLFYYNKETKENFSCSSISSNRHLSQFIKQIFLNNITNNKIIQEGVVTYYNVTNVLEDLSLFGYQNACVKRIATNNLENEYVYFWVGFPGNPVVMQTQANLVTNVALEIERQFSMYQKLSEASQSIRKKSEEANKKSEYLEFISHDLRSPLANLVTILKLLEVNNNEEDKKEFLEIAYNNCDSISLLLEDLLDFSKYKNANLIAYKEIFNVEKEILEIVNSYKLRASQKGLKLYVENNLYSKKLINVDKRQFKKIVNNILSNAIKYTKEGEVKVVCYEEGENVCISVNDTGIGMSEKTLELLFQSFKRGDNVENTEGYGIGLFMVNIFSLLNDISLDVSSKENVGTNFLMRIKAESLGDNIIEVGNVRHGGCDFKNTYKIDKDTQNKILILDDDVDLLRSMQKLFRAKGFDAKSYSTLEDTREYVLKNRIDLIISDYHIGDSSVDELLDFLQKENLKIDVVIVSGKMDLDFSMYSKRGVKAIYSKPLDFDKLVK